MVEFTIGGFLRHLLYYYHRMLYYYHILFKFEFSLVNFLTEAFFSTEVFFRETFFRGTFFLGRSFSGDIFPDTHIVHTIRAQYFNSLNCS